MKGEDRKHLCFVARAGLASWTVESEANRAAATATRETRRLRKSILILNDIRLQRLRKHDHFREFSFEGSCIYCRIQNHADALSEPPNFAKRLSRRSRFENHIRKLPEPCTADEQSWRIRRRGKRCCPPYKVCL